MKVAIIDDQKIWQNNIEERLRKVYGNSEIVKYNSGEEFLEDDLDYSIVFMDVELGGINGLDAAEKYLYTHPDTQLILTSADMNFSPAGYKIKAFGFVNKCSLDKICDLYKSAIGSRKQFEEICIKTILGDQYVQAKDVKYIEVKGKKRFIHLKRNIVESNESLEKISDSLLDIGFFSPCRSFCINLSYVYSHNKSEIKMKDEKKIPLSRTKIEKFKTAYYDWNY